MPHHRAVRQLVLSTLLLAFVNVETRGQAPTLGRDTTTAHVALFSKSDAVFGLGVVALSAATVAVDRQIAVNSRGVKTGALKSSDQISEAVPFMRRPGAFIATGGVFLLGRVVGSPAVADLGWHTLEAVVVSTGLSFALKRAIGRANPNFGGDTATTDFALGGGFSEFGRTAFPSATVAVAFAVASSGSAEFLRSWPSAGWIVAPLLYGGATAVAVSRIYDNRHWASDIVAGAGLGIWTGLKVVRYSHDHPNNFVDKLMLHASIVPSAGGGTLAFSFPTK
ncbi:MAG: phosphatase PAP2 family protein [Gemmatimonadaceae bacterium]|nr:phosphatase PAP2 family protein [Gemmatimonadaceae bacterium]